ncbi:glucose-6-phosphate dehydrogenase assembly protein OpcA [Actinokineospora alba]|uniref:Glucose-6-phosphate dehydrogenase assembly protein OpcA n=1 Tax=Actinokineospora alba TaxID=504798 RepID=A0A1H0VT88_9PSEU|nr:glucose-6-phosphate dehydrogenase assembly protein OpcA [Actinokineospora alba]TDP70102.1 glucose-6-phosphate dehydrogenase assembly protein OpcA [Actinokineospora alba]SDI39004.1 glucose-6-phosphate dehydrogenase assembly protein OpcA [Actinokineospora alba]SDP81670.1 glucose-6-phosphate dehydrogenase assembly protein OpcA [Actinokineospora alba]
MIIDLPSTTTSQVNSKLVHLREQGGANTLGRVLTLVIVTDDGERVEDAIDAANDASREHPCRVIVVARGAKKAAARLDAQIRIGGDAGASEVIVLRLYGPLADEGASCVIPLLLPDAPVVAWWPFEAPARPSDDPIGRLAQRRITDSAAERHPIKALQTRQKQYADGDTDLAWTRLTLWRAVLAASLDLPPYEKVTAASVSGGGDSPSTDLLAAWLATFLKVPVKRINAGDGHGIVSVAMDRRSGTVELQRPDGKVGTLTQPGQPARRVALQRREVRDCLSEELRRLDADEIYEATLNGLTKVTRGRATAARKPAPAQTANTPRPSAKVAARTAAADSKAKTTTGTSTAKSSAKTTAADGKAKPTGGTAKSSPNGSPASAKPRSSAAGSAAKKAAPKPKADS